jgi:hypothetical protein
MKTGGSIYNSKASRRPQWRYGAVVLTALAVSMLLTVFHPLGTAEWYMIDLFARWHFTSSPSKAPVAAVLIDDDVVNRPHGWPISKSAYEEAALYLLEMGASAIAFDVLFADDLSYGDSSDARFLGTAAMNRNLAFAWLAYTGDTGTNDIRAGEALSPFSAGVCSRSRLTSIVGAQLPYKRLLQNVKSAGFLNRGHAYADNVERRMPLIAVVNDSMLVPSLAMIAVMRAKSIESLQWNYRNNVLTLGNRQIPCDAKGEMLLDFSKEIPSYPLSLLRQSMDSWGRGKKPFLDSSQFTGRIVFIGNGAVSLNDFGVTPISRTSVSSFTPNVLLHARSAATMLSGKTPRCISTAWHLFIIFCLIAVLPFIRFSFPRYRRFLIAVLPCIVLPPFISYILFCSGVILFPLGLSLSAGILLLCDFVGAHRFNVHPADAPKAYNGDEPFLFISYKREQLREASRIMFRLQAMGCRIWYDREIHPGEEWPKVLRDKISQSKGVFFMGSLESITSKPIQMELRYALAVKKRIFPVRTDDKYESIVRSLGNSLKINPTVLNYCRKTQMIDLYDRQFRRVLKSQLQDLGLITKDG